MYKKRIYLNIRLVRFTVLLTFHFVLLQETCTPSVELIKLQDAKHANRDASDAAAVESNP